MRTKIIFFLLFCCYFLLVSCQTHQSIQGKSAKVQKVVSGQTLDVLVENNQRQERVRLIGIEVPDLQQQPWGINAKNKLSEWLNQEIVILELETSEKDQFGRILAHVWHNQELINEKLIAQGYALEVRDYGHKYSNKYQRAQEFARLMGYGIWNPAQPLRETPKEFRANN